MIDQKEEFVRLASAGSINFSQLCQRYAISRKTGYKWLARWAAGDRSSHSLVPLSSRPHEPIHADRRVRTSHPTAPRHPE